MSEAGQAGGQAWHLVLPAAGELAPFEGAAAEAAVAALRGAAARTGAVVLAFAVLPGELDLLLVPGDARGVETFVPALRRGATQRVNKLLGRRGTLFDGDGEATPLGDDDWLALAEAIEQRIVAAGLAAEPFASPACSAHPDHADWLRTVPRAAREERGRAADEPAPVGRRIGEFLGVRDVPLVVQLAEVAPLAAAVREESPGDEVTERVREYVVRWYLGGAAEPGERRALAVARTVLSGLGGDGGGWFVTGLYGAGKSHLLAVAWLASECAAARAELFAAQPALRDLRPALDARGERLVVPVALDEQPPSAALEDVVFAAAEQALAERTGERAPLSEPAHVVAVVREHLLDKHAELLDAAADGSWRKLAERDTEAAARVAQRVVRERGLPYSFAQSRVERLGRLLELVERAGLGGVVFLLDELSLFLAGRERAGLHADAGFLQFLGQRARLQPVWVIAALQKQIEDVGDIGHYTLRQIKDRFETRLTLPLTSARRVLAEKVLACSDERARRAAVDATVAAWSGGQRLTDLSPAALADTWPLHPLTFACLEACAERFLARTRSVIEFAARRVAGDELAPGVLNRCVPALITPDEMWDHFARDVAEHAELRRYREAVYDWYQRNLPALAPDDRELGLRVIKLLLVLRLSDLDRDARDIAAALLPAADDRETRVSALLETFRRHGAYVAVERRAKGRDVYRIDLEHDVNEIVRRRARALEATLTVGDGRLTATAVEACVGDGFPLATTLHPRPAGVVWRNTERSVFVALRDLRTLSPRELENQAALLSGRELEEAAYLWLAEPQRVDAQGEAFAEALAQVGDERWRHALVAWLPREASGEERAAWVHDVALELVRGDPTLASGQPGAAVRERLDEDAEARLARLARLLRRLYAEGDVVTAAGREPAPAGDWDAQIARVAERALERLFPRFGEVAPRRRVVSRATVAELVRDLVVPGRVSCSPASVLAAAVEDVAMPLGVASGEQGEYEVSIAADGAGAVLLERLPDRPVPLGAVERHLAKSSYGLTPELSHLLVAGLVRAGYLTPLGEDGRPAALGAPLAAHVAAVRPAALVDEGVWAALARVTGALFDREPGELDAGGQQALFERLVHWRAAVLGAAGPGSLADVRAGADRARQALGHEPLQWRGTHSLLESLETLARAVDPHRLARDGLTAFAAVAGELPTETLAELRARFLTLRRFAEQQLERLLAVHRDLRTVTLPPGELADGREALLARLAAGESVAFEADALLADTAAWRRSYADAYAAWHAEVHADARFAAYDAFRTGPLMRTLGNLSRLALDVPDSATAVAEMLRTERVKQCRRADLTLALRERLTCPDCRLALGERVPLRAVEELEAEAAVGVNQVLGALRRADSRERIARGTADLPADDPRLGHVSALLSDAPEPEALLAGSSFAVIDLLNTVLTTDVVAHRRLGDLAPRLAGKRLTKAQVREAVERWLDPDGRLGDDEVVSVDE